LPSVAAPCLSDDVINALYRRGPETGPRAGRRLPSNHAFSGRMRLMALFITRALATTPEHASAKAGHKPSHR
ncbi:MAG TPA: hypothetical protein VGY54_06330, partial [Polyangiaceae bacterium]|nr:hypothetical protein [Polyangiaceae bacterium]